MSNRLEAKMDEWQAIIDSFTLNVEDENPAVVARAKRLRKIIGSTIQGWKACDEAHTRYLVEHHGVEDFK